MVNLFFALGASVLLSSVFFCVFFLDLLGQLKCSLQFSATPPIWRKWHKQCMLSLRRNLWVVFIVYLKKNVIALPATPGGRVNCHRELCPSLSSSRPMVLKVEFPASSINITWKFVRNAVSQALPRPPETLRLGPCDLISSDLQVMPMFSNV